jgi:hypothetical protein
MIDGDLYQHDVPDFVPYIPGINNSPHALPDQLFLACTPAPKPFENTP